MPNCTERLSSLVARARESLAAREPAGFVKIQVGSATCEDAAGATAVFDELRKHVEASGRKDIVLRHVGCTGRCSREPIVNVMMPGHFPVKYQQVTRELVHEIFTHHVMGGVPLTDHVLDATGEPARKRELMFCKGGLCGRAMKTELRDAMIRKLGEAGLADQVSVVTANCFGTCSPELRGTVTHILVRPDKLLYRVRDVADLDEIIASHLRGNTPVERLLVHDEPVSQRFFELYGDVAFFAQQSRVALRNSGVIDPESIEEYLAVRGFQPLARALEQGDPQAVIEAIQTSKLRGRGGGGFPTGRKWSMAAASPKPTRYLICNADEGDPGAFMDRSMLEGDPFSVVEGMLLGAFAIGAHQGYVYVRAEYPLAVKRVQQAIDRCREWGLLGQDILGSGFDFDLEIRLGAGAFVCGEETALIHSIEGHRGQPRPRPPYPTDSGLWGETTVINNVETFANVPAILEYGPQWFAQIGTEKSGGTKVFALAGKVEHTGLVEVPMGTTLREVVFDIGGGVPNGKRLKAIQTGGPAGGCIPASMLDLKVDFETLTRAGSIMGSGGMIVMDEDDCMVDIARFFISFSAEESCGKCTPCREGTTRMLEILDRIVTGKGEPDDLPKLERLGRLLQKASLCGLGRAAPNPLLSTLTHFRDEYLAHIVDKRCPAVRCKALIHYEIDPEDCVGCTACARNCPVDCISGSPKKTHVIDQNRCIHCGRCFEVCRFNAVDRS